MTHNYMIKSTGRFYEHKDSFKSEIKWNTTELSNMLRDQKKKNIDTSLEWSILDNTKHHIHQVQETVCFA